MTNDNKGQTTGKAGFLWGQTSQQSKQAATCLQGHELQPPVQVHNMCSRTPTSTLFVPIVLGEQNILICVLSQHPSPVTFLRCSSHTTTPLPGSSEVPNQCHGPNFLPKSKPQEPWALALALPILSPTRCAPQAALRCTSLITSNPRRMKTKTRHSPGTEVQRRLHRPGAGSQERAHNSSEWQKNEDGREGEDWASPVCF